MSYAFIYGFALAALYFYVKERSSYDRGYQNGWAERNRLRSIERGRPILRIFKG